MSSTEQRILVRSIGQRILVMSIGQRIFDMSTPQRILVVYTGGSMPVMTTVNEEQVCKLQDKVLRHDEFLK